MELRIKWFLDISRMVNLVILLNIPFGIARCERIPRRRNKNLNGQCDDIKYGCLTFLDLVLIEYLMRMLKEFSRQQQRKTAVVSLMIWFWFLDIYFNIVLSWTKASLLEHFFLSFFPSTLFKDASFFFFISFYNY